MTDSARAGPAGYLGARWTLLRIRGVPLVIGPSLLLLVGLFTVVLARQLLPRAAFVDAPGAAWATAAVTTALFIASIFAHEVGHAVTSLDRGVEVRSITLFLLGGVTESVGEPESARDELVIVGIGPLISLVLAALCGVLVELLPDFSIPELVAGYLGWLNAAMAIFNLIPGYPLDGGRLLRAVVWMVTSSRNLATRVAARIGQAFAALLLVGAMLSVTGLPDLGVPVVGPVLRLAARLGLWGGLIGIFLLRSSVDAHGAARRRERLSRRRVRDLMGVVPPTVPSGALLADIDARLQQRPSVLWPVGRPLVGGVTLRDLNDVPRERWAATQVDAIAEPDVFISDDTPMDEAVERMFRARDQMLIVVRDGEPVGLLTPSLVVDAVT
ncbi:MAG TPA: site-2 protease family protein [Euzebyales bacterium]